MNTSKEWCLIKRGKAEIGWRISGGRFFVGAFQGEGTDAVKAVLAVRKVARRMGFTKMFWQVFPETGVRMLDAIPGAHCEIDYVQCYCNI